MTDAKQVVYQNRFYNNTKPFLHAQVMKSSPLVSLHQMTCKKITNDKTAQYTNELHNTESMDYETSLRYISINLHSLHQLQTIKNNNTKRQF